MNVEGYYVRINSSDSAELKVTILHNAPANHYRVQGTALWGSSRTLGPNIGTVDFIAHLEGRRLRFGDPPYEIRLDFVPNGQLWVGETAPETRHGMNVVFGGVYQRA
jgi:hypothetical protein